MSVYSDYRKFDDTLRMVLDCSTEEIEKIKNLFINSKNISYGIIISDHALMTCLVDNLKMVDIFILLMEMLVNILKKLVH